jgi:hemerythrin-like domain-containing protein
MSRVEENRDTAMIRSEGEAGQSVLSALNATLDGHFLQLSQLCSSLEDVADKLPNRVDPVECLKLANNIYPIVKKAHEFEESAIFPILVSRAPDDAHTRSSLDRLRLEHWEDESYAEELHDKLRGFATDRGNCSVEALSWMLRGFFEGVRRHMAFERECLIPLFGSDWQHHS